MERSYKEIGKMRKRVERGGALAKDEALDVLDMARALPGATQFRDGLIDERDDRIRDLESELAVTNAILDRLRTELVKEVRRQREVPEWRKLAHRIDRRMKETGATSITMQGSLKFNDPIKGQEG